jgi:hypothetical protein
MSGHCRCVPLTQAEQSEQQNKTVRVGDLILRALLETYAERKKIHLAISRPREDGGGVDVQPIGLRTSLPADG